MADTKKKTKEYTLTPEDYLKKDERKALLQTCKTNADADLFNGNTTWPKRYMLIDLALYTGLRVAEIAQLKIGDIYVGNEDDAHLIVRKGKGDKKRTVYFDKYLARHLKEYIAYKRKTLRQSVDADEPLFKGHKRKYSPPITFMKSFKAALKKAGIDPKKYSIHNCRHTYATYLLKGSGNLQYVQQQLGHSQREMTQLYAKILPEENGRLANTIERPELEI